MPTVAHRDVLACVESLPPVALVGLSLLRQPLTDADAQSGRWFPADIPSAQVVAATLELITYLDRCRAVAAKLADLRAVPCSFPVLEYPL